MISPARRRLVTAALLVGTFLSSLEVTVIGAAMPTVVSELHGVSLYAWAFSAYLLAQTITIPFYGIWADRRGRREAYLAGVVFFVGGSAVCAAATSMPMLVAGRAVQGIGAGAVLPLTMTLFGDMWPVRERTRLQGLFSLVWGVSSVLGPLVGGLVTEAVGWRGIFWLNLPPGALAGVVVGALVPAALGRGEGHQRHSRWGLLRDPTQQAVNGAGLLLGGALYGFIGYLPVLVQGVEGGDALDAGLVLLPLSLAWTAASNVGGRVVHRTGFRFLVRLGTALVAVGGVLAAWGPTRLVPLVLFGAGMGFTIASFTVAAQEAAPRTLRATATSLALFSRSIGSAVVVQAFGWLAGFRPGTASLADVPDLEAGVLRVFAGVGALSVLAALIVQFRFPSTAFGEEPEEPRAGG